MNKKTRHEILVDVEIAYFKAIQQAAKWKVAKSREGAIYESGKAVALAQILLENVLVDTIDVACKVERDIAGELNIIDPIISKNII